VFPSISFRPSLLSCPLSYVTLHVKWLLAVCRRADRGSLFGHSALIHSVDYKHSWETDSPSQLVQKFTVLYITRRVITAFTRAWNSFLREASWIQPALLLNTSLKPHLKVILLSTFVFSFRFSNMLNLFLTLSVHATFPAFNRPWIPHLFNIWWTVQITKLLFLHPLSSSIKTRSKTRALTLTPVSSSAS
jgi:hypothetical protein